MLNTNNIIWKDIEGFEKRYQVSNTGLIRSLVDNHGNARIRPRKTYIRSSTCEYEYVQLHIKDQASTISVHRAVAQAFIPKPKDKNLVNHIDGNKLNNNACNLEWCTDSENKLHAYALGLMPRQTHCIGVKVSTSSKYHNVSWDKSRKKWVASMKFNGKSNTKRFENEVDAAMHVNYLIDSLGITNRPKNIIS